MKEVLPERGLSTGTVGEKARWYQALTLTERSAALRSTGACPPAEQIKSEQVGQRLTRWKNLPLFRRSEQHFKQRLAADGLTEESLLALLAQSAEDIQATFTEEPTWLVELLQAFTQPDPAILACLPLQNVGDPPTDAMFLALKPLLARGFARLQAGIAELQRRFADVPFSQQVGFLLLPHFLELVLNKPAKTLMSELNAARVQGYLQGETPEERFLFFLRQLSQPENLLALLEKYPVLGRQLVEMTESWVTRELELLQRLCEDWSEIRALFAPTDNPGVLCEVKEGLGDPHQGGRSVSILTWSSGLRLVYKPRPLAIDVHFQEVLEWLNTCGYQPAFRTATLLNKGDYGWYECFLPTGCASKEEIERFYQRMGGYLALLYAMEATDFHAENLIAAGEHPLFIDLESLFQPYAEQYEGANTYGYELLTHSVRRVGLLPQRQWLHGEASELDLSGLGAPGAQGAAITANSWSGLGTDTVQATRERVTLKLGDHRPTLQGEEVQVLEYEQHIVTGFTTVYRLLLQHRDEFLQTLLPRFAHDRIRVLCRPTHVYALLQSDSFHPAVLRDALERDLLFDRLWIGVEHAPYLAQIVAAERADLQRNDIPKFTTTPASRDLFTADGIRIADFLPSSSLDLARKGIQTLSEGDLERQAWIIRASFACMELNSVKVTPKQGLPLQLTQTQVERAAFLNEARAIADRLLQLALVKNETIGWLVLNPVGGQEWRPVPAGPDLYNGLPGIALFLAYLGELSGEQRYADMARLAVKTLREIFLPRTGLWQWGTIGAFDGLGSLIYLFSHLGSLWHDPTLCHDAEEMLPLLRVLLKADKACDFLAGAAGSLSALLSLYTASPEQATLDAAIWCGEHILEQARSMPQGIAWSPQEEGVPLAGISHGNAGIALSLLRLATVTGDERFRQAARQAMEYERSLFCEEKHNWPDLREVRTLADIAHKQDLRYMIAWCHGAPGIGLARLASLQHDDDAAIRLEIDEVVQCVLEQGFGRNHSLCHGDMGNLEVLLLATQFLPDYARTKIDPLFGPLQTALLESMHTQGWLSGIPRPMETPGLMLGLAGTGYALLRLFNAARVPSLLVLAPPQVEHR